MNYIKHYAHIIRILIILISVSLISCERNFDPTLGTYTVTFETMEYGTAKASKTQVGYNGEVTLTATPQEGYRFVNWTVKGEVVSKENPYTAQIIRNTQFRANFEKEIYTIRVTAGEGGTAKTNKSKAEYNEKVTLIATPNEGSLFVNWTQNGEEVSISAICTVTITANAEFKANFITHKVTLLADEGGAAKASKMQVAHNGKVTLTATPKEGYSFVNWTVNGKEVSVENPYTATITEDTEFKANFIITHKVTVVSGEGGTAKADKTQVVPNGQVTLIATPKEGYSFVNWTVNGEEVSKEAIYAVIVTNDIEYVANFMEKYNGYEYIDLGLSVKWATCNVGATTPEEYGDYFSWGETAPKKTYTWDNYYYPSYLPISLPLQEDAARANWGGCWRMPTKAEQDELRNNCTWYFVTQNGVNGCKAISKKNGNSIFFPLAGFFEDNRLVQVGETGHYRSTSRANHPLEVYYLLLYEKEGVRVGASTGRCGFTVRAVCE